MNDADAVVTRRQYVLGSSVTPLAPIAPHPTGPVWFDLDQVATMVIVSPSILSSTVYPLFVALPVSRTKAAYWIDQTSIVMDFRGLSLVECHSLPLRPPKSTTVSPPPPPSKHKKGGLVSAPLIISA